jgi:hypothetical protein
MKAKDLAASPSQIGDLRASHSFLRRSIDRVVSLFQSAAWFSIRHLVGYALVPTAVFTALGKRIYMMHPLVNADYLALGIVAPWLPVPFVFFSYFLLLLNELIVNVAPIYHFSIGEFLLSARYLIFVNHQMIFETGASVVAGALLTSWFALRIARGGNRKFNSLVLLGFAFIICSLDVLNGTSFLPTGIGSSFADINFAYSGVRRTVMSLTAALETHDAVFSPLTSEQAATGPLFDELLIHESTALKENVVLVVVESMGRFVDEQTQQLLLREFHDPKLLSRYDVRFKKTPFHGATIQGEFRELCRVRLEVYGDHLPSQCLPSLYKSHGYEALAYHGFTNQFYRRYQWYPKLGFDRIYFAEELKQLGVGRNCGSSFTGICDQDVISEFRKELIQGREGNSPRFIHWMTLNSHLPISPAEGEESSLDCSQSKVLSGSKMLCAYTHLIDQVLTGIVDLANDPKLLPTRFILVGDHAPPFKAPSRRDQFDLDDVTAIELVPKRSLGKLSL